MENTTHIVSLKDLRNEGINTDLSAENNEFKTIDPKNIIINKEAQNNNGQDEEVKSVVAKEFSKIDDSFDRVKKDLLENVIPKGKELLYEAKIKKEFEDEQDQKNEADDSIIEEKSGIEPNINFNDEDDDNIDNLPEDEEETSEDNNDIEDENGEKYSSEYLDQRQKIISDKIISIVKEKIKPINEGKIIDLTKFKVKIKPVTYSKVLARTEVPAKIHTSDWVLPNSKKVITMKEFAGTDIEALNISRSGMNTLNTIKRLYATIYSHIVDANKPSTLEEWTKSIDANDIPHLMFAVFKASFENSCFIPYTCQNLKCNNAELTEYKIKDFLKFDSEQDKKAFYSYLEHDSTSNTEIEEVLIQVSPKYVFGLKSPTIYNMVFEITALDHDFVEKYNSLLSNMAFISNIYYININDSSLEPISFAPKSEDLRASVKNKVKIINKIFKELTSDQYMSFVREVGKLNSKQLGISYRIPPRICSKCNHQEAEMIVDNPLELVFTRHQLTLIANS